MVGILKTGRRESLFLLGMLITLTLIISTTYCLDKNKFNKMDQFKKNFQFDLEEDDTIVKDVQDYTSQKQKDQQQNKEKLLLDENGNQIFNEIDQQQDQLDDNPVTSQHTTQYKTSACSIFDRCRVCSFKELQQMQECQETGYRLIKRCIKRDQSTGSIIEDRYENQSCELFQGTLQEYRKDKESTTAGQYAEPGTNPYGMGRFMVFMGLCGVIVTAILNNRKDRILHEIYSKISIVNRN